MQDSIALDVIGFIEGTTKSSVWVDFLRHYERHLAEFRSQKIQLLEIGILDGASLLLWKKWFPNLGDLLARQQSYEAATRAFNNALDANPAHFPSYRDLGRALGQQQKTAEAKTVLRRALATNAGADWAAVLNKDLAELEHRHS